MNYSLLDHVDEISPRPILMIVATAASRFFSEQVYERAAEPKELYIVEDAEHIDLYDRTDRIPFDKIESFLRKNLNKREDMRMRKMTILLIFAVLMWCVTGCQSPASTQSIADESSTAEQARNKEDENTKSGSRKSDRK